MVMISDSDHSYLYVVEEIKKGIETGKYKVREKLPSDFELSRKLGVSRVSLTKALHILEEENFIIKRHGVGVFVNSRPILSSGIEELNSVTKMIEQSGKKAGVQYLSTEIISPSEEEQEKFQLDDNDKLIQVERIRTADGEPIVFCIDKVPEKKLPLKYLYKEESIFKLMEVYADQTIAYAVTHIEPVNLYERIYEVLNCPPEQALLLLKQMHYTAEDEPVLYSANFFRPDIFSFHVLRKRL